MSHCRNFLCFRRFFKEFGNVIAETLPARWRIGVGRRCIFGYSPILLKTWQRNRFFSKYERSCLLCPLESRGGDNGGLHIESRGLQPFLKMRSIALCKPLPLNAEFGVANPLTEMCFVLANEIATRCAVTHQKKLYSSHCALSTLSIYSDSASVFFYTACCSLYFLSSDSHMAKTALLV